MSLLLGHVPFKGSIRPKEQSRCDASILVFRSWSSSASPSAVPCHQEGNQKDQNCNGVKQTLWTGSDATENDATLYMNF